MNDYLYMNEIEDMLQVYGIKRRPTIGSYCRDGLIPSRMDAGKWTIERSFICQAMEWRKRSKTLDELIQRFPIIDSDTNTRRRVLNRIEDDWLYTPDNIPPEGLLFTGRFVNPEHIDDVAKAIVLVDQMVHEESVKVPLGTAAKRMNMSSYQAKTLINSGNLKSVEVNHKIYIPQDEITKYNARAEEYVGIYDLLCEITSEMPSHFDPHMPNDRASVGNYLKSSVLADKLYYSEDVKLKSDAKNFLFFKKSDLTIIRSAITKYIDRIDKRRASLNIILQDAYWDSHPKTASLLWEFYQSCKKEAAVIYIAKEIMDVVTSEIMDCTDADICRLINHADKNDSCKTYLQTFTRFLRFVRSIPGCRFRVSFFDYKSKFEFPSDTTEPYTNEQYFKMGIMCLTKDYIQSHHLTDKALESPRCSALWIETAMYYVASWRDSDILHSLPIMQLDDPELIVEQIKSDTYGKDAAEVSERLECLIYSRHILPHKTSESQKTETLRICIPESIREVFGTIYTIYALHHIGTTPPQYSFRAAEYLNFFGPEYYDVFGKTAFSNRRANKTYMSLIKQYAEQSGEGNICGIILASFARSHVKGPYEYGQTTPTYLRHDMEGYTADEVTEMLFEAGVLSFIPNILLEAVYGDDYKVLSVKDRAEIVAESNLTALTAEHKAKVLREASIRANECAQAILSLYDNRKQQKSEITRALTTLATHGAGSKTPGTQCLLDALHERCLHQDAGTCIGCPYCVMDKSFVHILMNTLQRSVSRYRTAATKAAKSKWMGLITHTYLPAAYETLLLLQDTYHTDTTQYWAKLSAIAKEIQHDNPL